MKKTLLILLTVMASYGFLQAQTFSSSSLPIADTGTATLAGIRLGDFDGDGDMDILTQDGGAETEVTLWKNDGAGNYTSSTAIAAGISGLAVAFTSVRIADFDNDGDLDFYQRISGANNDIFLENNGTGSFSVGTLPLTDTGITNFALIQVGDFDSDGDVDILTQEGGAATAVTLWTNNGSGSFTGTEAVASGFTGLNIGFTSVRIADFDNDGDLDYYQRISGGSNDIYMVNNGSGIFSIGTLPLPDSGTNNHAFIQVGDFDNDGDIDFLTQEGGMGAAVTFLKNNGAGNYSSAVVIAAGVTDLNLSHVSLRLGDYDNDGDLDFLLRLSGLGNDMYYQNQGAPPTLTSFTPAANGTAGANDNLMLTFSHSSTLSKGAGSISIREDNGDGNYSNDAIFESFAVGDTRVSLSGNATASTVTINPNGSFASGKNYYVVIAPSAFVDAGGKGFVTKVGGRLHPGMPDPFRRNAENSLKGLVDRTLMSFSTLSSTPTVTGVTSSTANGAYKVGDIIAVSVNFSEAVTVTGTPQITLETGATDRTINYASGSGTSTLTFNYTVQTGDNSTDLDYTTTTALALNGGAIKSVANSSANLTLPSPGAANSLAANKNIVVDGVLPTVNGVTSSTANGAYKIGDVIAIHVNFSETVNVTGTPQITLETGTTDRTINYASGSGTSTLTFNYTVQGGDNTSDLDYISTLALVLNSGTIRDAANNNAVLLLPSPGTAGSLGTNKAIVIDGVRPTATITLSNNGLVKGETTLVTFTFSEAVSDFTSADLTFSNGSFGTISSSDGGITWTTTFTPTDNLEDATNVIILNNTGVQDLVGNAGTGNTQSNNFTIDTKSPTVASVMVPANGSYKIGDNLDFTVNFSEAVTVSVHCGTPTIAISLGTGTVYANYVSGSGTSALLFRHVVAEGEQDANGIALTSLTLNGGLLNDIVGNNPVLTLNSVASTANVLVDGVRPTVTISSSVGASGTTTATSPIPFTITFSEAVTDFSLADISLTNGTAGNFSGSGTSYNFNVTPMANGNVTVNVLANVATDAVGNNNSAAAAFTINYLNTLPVVLVDFNVKKENNAAKLQWQTATETNNKGFEIYRSGDDKQWVKIGGIDAKGSSSIYAFADKQPLNGNNYYKLVQLDLDGTPTELGERALSFALSAVGLRVYPNPTAGKVTLSFGAGKYQKVSIIGLDGKVLNTASVLPSQTQVRLDLSAYTSGIYFVKLSGAIGVETQKLIKK
ncbi:Ig-like domain-containing protein [Pedobacter helvus]|uniref:Ig-like domain-containing protein n=1 Tax=Pedobacter helvus TaxID=2563444 RepID=A0ABW9JHT9_9SPHI|nr:Ig-like domain-containing protein [Pedobacter ureilyticus]